MQIGVVTDSASDLPPLAFDAERVICVPLDVRLGDADPLELQALSNEDFWALIKTSPDLPTTAAPSPGAFIDAYKTLFKQGCDAIVTITISSELSATYQSASVAVSQLQGMPPIVVIDSRNATMGEGLLVLEALSTRHEASDLAAFASYLSSTRDRIRTFGTLDTLDNLRRGGRIGGAQAFFGALLAIKPIIEVRDGRIEGISRQRTRSRSLAYLADMVHAAGPLSRIAVVHAAASDIGSFVGLLDDIDSGNELTCSTMGPVVGAHTGIGTIGVALLTR